MKVSFFYEPNSIVLDYIDIDKDHRTTADMPIEEVAFVAVEFLQMSTKHKALFDALTAEIDNRIHDGNPLWVMVLINQLSKYYSGF
jgi:hypothetical protein